MTVPSGKNIEITKTTQNTKQRTHDLNNKKIQTRPIAARRALLESRRSRAHAPVVSDDHLLKVVLFVVYQLFALFGVLLFVVVPDDHDAGRGTEGGGAGDAIGARRTSLLVVVLCLLAIVCLLCLSCVVVISIMMFIVSIIVIIIAVTIIIVLAFLRGCSMCCLGYQYCICLNGARRTCGCAYGRVSKPLPSSADGPLLRRKQADSDNGTDNLANKKTLRVECLF